MNIIMSMETHLCFSRHLTVHLAHVTGSGGATFQTDPKKFEHSCGPKCCVKDRSIKIASIQGTTTITMRPRRCQDTSDPGRGP